MKNNRIRIETPEELVEYCRNADTNIKMNTERAEAILYILNDAKEKLYITEDKKIQYTNLAKDEGETVDDLVDYVCGLNYLQLAVVFTKINDNAVKRDDFVEFCKLKKQEEFLEKNMDTLNEMFGESTHGKECQSFAAVLSIQSMKDRLLRPVYDYLFDLVYSYYGEETDRILDEDEERRKIDPEGWEREKEEIHQQVLKEHEEKLKKEQQKKQNRQKKAGSDNQKTENQDKQKDDIAKGENKNPNRNEKNNRNNRNGRSR